MEEDVLKKQREITPQIEAEDIADAVVYVLSTNPKVQVSTLINTFVLIINLLSYLFYRSQS